MSAHCLDCCFWSDPYENVPGHKIERDKDPDSIYYGVCKRFPTTIQKDKKDWCGEWMSKEE